MKKGKILFRCDANNEIGSGHLNRCLAIAGRIETNFQVYFATKGLNNKDEILIKKKYKLITINKNLSLIDETEFIYNSICSRIEFNYIVLDGYNFNTNYQKILKKNVFSKIISIDDHQPFKYVSDIVINHAIVPKYKIKKELYTKVFSGLEYLLIKKDFFSKNNQHIKAKINSILICFGGSDSNNMTIKFLKLLNNFPKFETINVIFGKFYIEPTGLNSHLKNKNINIFKDVNTREMLSLMNASEIIIAPSSTISLEAFSLGKILITGYTDINQKGIYKSIITKKNVYGLGNLLYIKKQDFYNVIKNAFIKKNKIIASNFVNKKTDPLNKIFK